MARPTNKEELLKAGSQGYEKLWELIDSLSDEEVSATFAFADRDRNIRDVLVHLYEWHKLLLDWVESNQKGIATPFLPKPYNWKTYPEMNVKFWESHQQTTYETAVKLLNESHDKVLKLIEGFSDDELFVKKYFSWTGTTSLGSYCVSATSSHYDWAIKKIKKHVKSYRDIEKEK